MHWMKLLSLVIIFLSSNSSASKQLLVVVIDARTPMEHLQTAQIDSFVSVVKSLMENKDFELVVVTIDFRKDMDNISIKGVTSSALRKELLRVVKLNNFHNESDVNLYDAIKNILISHPQYIPWIVIFTDELCYYDCEEFESYYQPLLQHGLFVYFISDCLGNMSYTLENYYKSHYTSYKVIPYFVSLHKLENLLKSPPVVNFVYFDYSGSVAEKLKFSSCPRINGLKYLVRFINSKVISKPNDIVYLNIFGESVKTLAVNELYRFTKFFCHYNQEDIDSGIRNYTSLYNLALNLNKLSELEDFKNDSVRLWILTDNQDDPKNNILIRNSNITLNEEIRKKSTIYLILPVNAAKSTNKGILKFLSGSKLKRFDDVDWFGGESQNGDREGNYKQKE